MTKARYLLLLAASAALLPACTQADDNRAGETTQAETAADEQAIRGLNERWLELIRA